MFGKTEVNLLFPTCVWKYELSDTSNLNKELMSSIERLRETMPLRSRDRGVWQSAGDLNSRPEFKTFMEAVITAIRGVFDYLRIQSEGIIITSSWANVSSRGYAHHRHTHPNNFLSGIYYVKTPPDSGNIVFKDPRPQAGVLVPSYSEFTPHTLTKHVFKTEEGILLLFPSWLEHYVEEHGAEEDGVSIAFNAVPKGRLGNEFARLDI